MSTAHNHWYYDENRDQENYYDGIFNYIDESKISSELRTSLKQERRELEKMKVKEWEKGISELLWFNKKHQEMMCNVKPKRTFDKMIII